MGDKAAQAAQAALRLTLADVQAAAQRIKGNVHVTPVMTSQFMDAQSGKSLFFKCENMQKGGSFKTRGATNAVLSLPSSVTTVVTHSSGNHAQALAIAAKAAGIKAHIVMPDNAPAVKRAAVLGYGAQVTDCPSTQKDREETADRVLRETPNSVLIPPYDDTRIIAGQGTVAIELLEQVPDLDAIIVPVGGGGLISGIAIAAKGLKPDIKIIAAEPKQADDCARSKAANERIPLDAYPDTVADGLRTSLGFHNWPIIQDKVDEVVTVSEEDIISAMWLVFERMKLVIEPSAGVPAAVALSETIRSRPELKRIGVILCGGNQDLSKLPWMPKS